MITTRQGVLYIKKRLRNESDNNNYIYHGVKRALAQQLLYKSKHMLEELHAEYVR